MFRKTFFYVCLALAAFWVISVHSAQAACAPGWGRCPGGCAPLGSICCGRGYCNRGTICTGTGCLSRSSPRVCANGRYCPPGHICTNDGRCLSTSSRSYCGGRRYCRNGGVCTNSGCLSPNSIRLCSNGRYCSPGHMCMNNGRCLPTSSRSYCGGRRYCRNGGVCTNDGCLPSNSIRLCSNGRYCPPGHMCMNNGRCLSTSSRSYCGGRRYCQNGSVCSKTGCIPRNSPRLCANGAYCNPGYRCRSDNKCERTGNDSYRATDCGPGELRINGTCRQIAGLQCGPPLSGNAGSWRTCPKGFLCINRKCVCTTGGCRNRKAGSSGSGSSLAQKVAKCITHAPTGNQHCNSGDSLEVRATNTCTESLRIRICIERPSKKPDCGTFDIGPGRTYPYYTCHSTGRYTIRGVP